MNPKLRPLQIQPVPHQGDTFFMVQDPLRISDRVLMLPRPLAAILPLCDGTRDIKMLQASLAVRAGVYLDIERVAELVQRLDEALFLDNDRFREAVDRALREYRSAPYRAPALAGLSYPEDADALRDYLSQWVNGSQDSAHAEATTIKAVISPHIDYPRGGPVYARTWQRVAAALREIDVAVIFGTDHNGGLSRITLTRVPYASPWGSLPTDHKIVDALAEALGEEAVFAEELHHRTEHSAELAFVWLHYMLGERRIPVVPILCGSLHHHIEQGTSPAEDPVISTTIAVLREATAGRRVLWVAAADLAHVGPAFGASQPLDLITRARLRAADQRLLEAIQQGDADRFFEEIRAERDRWQVCGVTPIYLTLTAAAPVEGELIAYEHCPADAQNGSVVTIAGVILRSPR